MNAPVIWTAHSRNKHGFVCYSHERYSSERYGITKSGWHIVSGDTLEQAQRELHERLRYDWRDLTMPEIVDCGKCAAIDGQTHTYRPRS